MAGFLQGLSKLILGVAIALILLSLAGVATARYFMGRLSVLPPRPVFEGETSTEGAATAPAEAPATAPEPAPEAVPEPAPSPEPEGYAAVVTQPIGLVIRAEPSTASQQLGGVDYNAQVQVLEDSDDGRWMLIRVSASGQEGWVKAGNTRSLN
ncbi:SH3 domain-containing protein [filamentous cyanobacterium CCP5]|nr:SH3 domain-containing protein [filamentous cyanobacterium CCP5]